MKKMKEKVRIPKVIENRVIKRYGFATFFYAFLMLCFVAVPVVSLFIPIIGVGNVNSEPIEFTSLTTLDLVKGLAFQPNAIIEAINDNFEIFSKYEIFVFAVFFAYGLLVLFSWACALIQFCKAFKLIVYGRSSHMFRPIITGLFAFIWQALLLAAGFVIKYLADEVSEMAGYPLVIGVSYVPIILLGVELLLFIAMIITYSICFSHKLYLYDIDMDYYQYDIMVEDFVPEEIKGLEGKISRIGPHQYAKSDISYAFIPAGITYIGEGAFSNCVKLESVLIPKSVKEIKFNAFFHCPRLTKIKYNGTKLQWAKVKRGSNWLNKCGTDVIECKDGHIKVDIYK